MTVQNTSIYSFGAFEFDLRSAELRKSGVKLKLQDQPRQVLIRLLEHRGEAVTREELRSLLWKENTFVDFETGLNTAVKRLRETLGDSADIPPSSKPFPARVTNSLRRSKCPVATQTTPMASRSQQVPPSAPVAGLRS